MRRFRRRRRARSERVLLLLRGAAAADGVPEPGAGAVRGHFVPDVGHAPPGDAGTDHAAGLAPVQARGELFQRALQPEQVHRVRDQGPVPDPAGARGAALNGVGQVRQAGVHPAQHGGGGRDAGWQLGRRRHGPFAVLTEVVDWRESRRVGGLYEQ